jgi:hypothetical protein
MRDLYRGTTHRDREDLYISVVGGLSFDISREKFRTIVMRTLAPRLGITVTDEHCMMLFTSCDVARAGAIPYYDFLVAQCDMLVSQPCARFVVDLFRLLCYYRRRHDAKSQIATELRALAVEARRSLGHGLSVGAGFGAELEESAPPSPSNAAAATGVAKVQNALKPRLTLRAVDLARPGVRRGVFELLNCSTLFPHPTVEAFCDSVAACFADVGPSDAVELVKFRLLLFCDDDVARALAAHVK